MKNRILIAAAFALLIFPVGTYAQGAAPTQGQVQAPESDYPFFRGLAEPFKLIDALIAGTKYELTNDPEMAQAPAEMRAAMLADFTQALNANREILTDKVMRVAFNGFSHDEVVRLTTVGAPVIAAVQQQSIDAVARGEMRNTNDDFATDPGFKALSGPDQTLVMRFVTAVTAGFDAAKPDFDAVLNGAARHAAQPAQ